MTVDVNTTVEERLQHGPLSPDEAVRLVWGLCDRFEKHGKTETLGDVSPQWVAITGRLLEERRLPGLIPGFSAPERATLAPTPRSDVYAMGSLLAYAVMGPRWDGGPFPREAAHLQAIVERCRSSDPDKRYANLSELKRALVRMDKTLMSGPKSSDGAAFSRTTLGPWKLEGLLGQGSMGHVFRAKHEALGRLSAIKVLRPEQYANPELVHRFFQEARTVNQINHEHIVEISDFVQEPGPKGPAVVYCVMEFLQGRTLGDELEDGPLPLARGLRIIEQLADALSAAHRVGVVHRDVKPDNIMLIERGGSKDYVKVLDFGVAKLTDTDGKAMVSTTEGAIIGTPICMSPEQAQGEDIDARSDVWAVGVILYRLITGVFPFDAPTFVNIAVQIITKPYAPLPAKTIGGEAIPPRLAALVERCLQKRRDLRPGSMDEVRDELRAILQPAEKPASNRLPLVLALGVVGALLAGGVGWKLSGDTPDEKPPVVLPPLPPPVAPVVVEDAGASDVGEPVDAGGTSMAIEPEDAGVPDAGVKVKPPPPKPVPFTEELATKWVRRIQPLILGCGNRHMTDLSALAGQSLKLQLTIPESGRVTFNSSPPLKGGLKKCVEEKLKQNPFPENRGDARSKFRLPVLELKAVSR